MTMFWRMIGLLGPKGTTAPDPPGRSSVTFFLFIGPAPEEQDTVEEEADTFGTSATSKDVVGTGDGEKTTCATLVGGGSPVETGGGGVERLRLFCDPLEESGVVDSLREDGGGAVVWRRSGDAPVVDVDDGRRDEEAWAKGGPAGRAPILNRRLAFSLREVLARWR